MVVKVLGTLFTLCPGSIINVTPVHPAQSVPGRNPLLRGGEGGLYCHSGGNEDGPSEGEDLVGHRLAAGGHFPFLLVSVDSATLLETGSPVP